MRVIKGILRTNRFNRGAAHLLSLGFRPASEGAQTEFGGVENFYPNTLLQHFKTLNWTLLHSLMGDDLMTSVLERFGIFVPLQSGNYLQICGFPISEMNTIEPKRELAVLSNQRSMLFCQRSRAGRFRIAKPSNGLSSAESLALKIFGLGEKERSKPWAPKLSGFASFILKRHRQCPYSEFLDYYVKSDDSIRRQTPKTAVDDSLLTHSSNYADVSNFAFAVIKWVLPKDIAKCKVFMRHLKKKLQVFIRLRKNEAMSVAELTRGLPLSECIWNPLQSSSAESSKIMKKLVEALLVWIFNDYLVQLLKISFYITESTAHAKRLFYFRHDVWNRLTAPYLNALKVNMYHGPLVSSHNRPNNKLRLVPKGPSFRPVVNFRSSTSLAPDLLARGRAVQNGLRNLHHILYYSARNNPALLGTSLLSVDEVCSKLKDFNDSANVSEKPLYFVKIDFTSCFDNIPTAKLLDVITEKALPKVSPTTNIYQISCE